MASAKRSCALVALLLGACSDSGERVTKQSTPMLEPTAPAAAPQCTPPYSINAMCDPCLGQQCCDVVSACAADAECLSVYGCFSMCAAQPGLDGCPGRCFGNGAPPPRFDAVLSCIFASCTADCTEAQEE